MSEKTGEQPKYEFVAIDGNQAIVGRRLDSAERHKIGLLCEALTETQHFARLYEATIENPHPNLAQIHSCFPGEEEGVWYEYYYYIPDAVNLEEALDDAEMREVIQQNLKEYVRGFFDGIRHLHKFGILHKDFKLANTLFCLGTGFVIVDFKAMGLVGERNLLPGVGTRHLAPTEVFLRVEDEDDAPGVVLDERTDVFLASAEIAELLLRLAYPEEKIKIFSGPYKELGWKTKRKIEDKWGSKVAEVLAIGMARYRDDRYKTIDELQKAIIELL